jgi:hypothetical protein
VTFRFVGEDSAMKLLDLIFLSGAEFGVAIGPFR